jgi:hypothetical protein
MEDLEGYLERMISGMRDKLAGMAPIFEICDALGMARSEASRLLNLPAADSVKTVRFQGVIWADVHACVGFLQRARRLKGKTRICSEIITARAASSMM